MTIKLFLDDVRDPPDSTWHLYRPQNPGDMHLFYHFAKHAEVISLDHDFGDDVDFDGYKVACQLERLAATTVGGIRKDVQILSHSQNPEGRARIEAAARSIKRILEQAT